MSAKTKIYQFRIELIDSEPKIWRQVQVPSTFNMFDLHGALNDVMGWTDYHFHVFKALNLNTKRIDLVGRPIDETTKGPVVGKSVQMTTYFMKPGDQAEYWYDFGDRWEHSVVLEKILPVVEDKCYPVCVNGERACPPEDSGGTDGYYQLLEILKDQKHPQHASRWKWLKDTSKCMDFEANEFEPGDVHFRPSELRKYPFHNVAEARFYDCIQM